MKKTLALALVLSFAAACNKKADAPAANGSASAGSAVVTAVTPPLAAAAPGAAATVGSYDDYKKVGSKMMGELQAVFVADGTNCDKLGDDMDKIVTDRKAQLDALNAYEKAHPDDKKKYQLDPESQAQEKGFMDAAGPAIEKCRDNAKLKAALAKLD